MAAPNFNLNLSVISDCDSTTGWDDGATEPDIKKQGTNSLVTAIRDGGVVTYTPATALDMSGTDAHLRMWFIYTFQSVLETKANGGIRLWVDDGTNTNYYYVGGSDTHPGSWELLQADLASPDINGGANLASITSCGFELVNVSASRNIDNTYWDYFVFGTGYEIYGGTSSDKVTWDTVATADETNGYGIIQKINGVYFANAEILLGDSQGTNDLYFDGGDSVVAFYQANESSTLYKIVGTGNTTGTTDIIMDSSVFLSDSTRFEVDMTNANIDSFSMTGTKFDTAGTIDFVAGQTIKNCVFYNCGQVTPSTSIFSGNSFSNYTGGTSAALLFPSDGINIKDLDFSLCENGVEYGIGSDPTSPSFDNFQFDDNNFFYDVYNTSGSAVTINKNNGSNPNSYNPAGSAVTFAGASVNTVITVQDIDTGAVIEGARALVWVADGTNFPYQDSISIVSTGTTATVTHTSHGLSTGDSVIIEGANEDPYNGAYDITVTGTDTYTYEMNEDPASPATGTIVSTLALINGTTDINGQVSDTRSFGSNQEIYGWIRKASGSPYYKQGVISGTVDLNNGFNTTIQLVKDE